MRINDFQKSGIPYLALILVMVCVFFYAMHNLTARYKTHDRCYFGGDQWEYQALAVNMVLGRGYKLGCQGDFEAFKYFIHANQKQDEGMKKRFVSFQKLKYSFYRSPGYPFFIAAVYFIKGISPETVYKIQIILTALSASLFVLLGFLHARLAGIIGGAAAGIIFTAYYNPLPNIMMGEVLFIFCLCIWSLLFVLHQRSENIFLLSFLAAWSGWLILVKGLAFFIPILVCGYFIFKGIAVKDIKKAVLKCLFFLFCTALPILPWSFYASSHWPSPVAVSTQTQRVLFDGNNEASFSDGGWHQEWRWGGSEFYYKRVGGKSAVLRVLGFWKENAHRLHILFFKKLQAGFWHSYIPWLLLGLFLYPLVMKLLQRKDLFAAANYILFLNIFLMTLVAFGYYRFTFTFAGFFLYPAAMTFVYLIVAATRKIFSKHPLKRA